MATAAGIIVTAGFITIVNDALPALTMTVSGKNAQATQAQVTEQSVLASINWRVIPATAVAAVIFAGLEGLNPTLAKGLAGVALLTTLIHPFGNGASFVQNLSSALGYGSNGASNQTSAYSIPVVNKTTGTISV